MPEITIAQRFGTNVTFNETTKILTIDLNDLTDTGDITDGLGLDVSGMSAANIDSYSGKILYTLLLLNLQQQPAENNDETLPLFVSNSGRRSITRNGVAQFGYGLTTTAYQTDQVGTLIDPDNMVT